MPPTAEPGQSEPFVPISGTTRVHVDEMWPPPYHHPQRLQPLRVEVPVPSRHVARNLTYTVVVLTCIILVTHLLFLDVELVRVYDALRAANFPFRP
jgi:hypothetical protein